MAGIPYLGVWDNVPPGERPASAGSWSNVAPNPKTLPGTVPISAGPARTDIPFRVPVNDSPEGHPFAPSGITQLAGYLLLSSGPDDQIMNSAGGFLLYAGAPGMFSNTVPVASVVPGVSWDNSAPAGKTTAFPPFNNSPGLGAPLPPGFGASNNTPPGGAAVPPGQGSANNSVPVAIPLPFAGPNNVAPVPESPPVPG
jgi:hypothetical protein